MEKIQALIQPLIDQFEGHPYLQAGVVVVGTFLLARALGWVLVSSCKAMTSRTQTTIDDAAFDYLRTPLVYTLLMIGLSLATRLLPIGENPAGLLINTLQTIGVVVWMVFFIRITKLFLTRQADNSQALPFIQPATLPLFRNVSFIIIVVLGLYVIFSIWGIDMTAWMASAGILGIAVGFAAKDTLANLFSGVFILADMPYKIGDYVVLDSGERGAVTHIGIRSTRLLTRDDVEMTIPNSIMGNSKIVNQSGGPYEKFRIRIPVGVAYGSDIDQVRALLMSVAKGNPSVCSIPAARVRFRALGASSLDFELLCWVDKPVMRGRVTDELLTAIYKLFNAEGVEIPYAKQDVYIKEMPALAARSENASSEREFGSHGEIP